MPDRKPDPYPSHPLGTISVKIGRAFMQSTGRGTFNTVIGLGMVSGSGREIETGTKISYAIAMDGSMVISFTRDGDSDEMKHQQRYTIDLHDVIEVLLRFNEKRRESGFNDAPPLEAK